MKILACDPHVVDAKDADGTTALHLAVKNDFPFVLSALLTAKPDVDAADKQGITALMLAARHPDTLHRLLLAGPQLSRHDQGAHALTRSMLGGTTESTALLLDHGVDIDHRGPAGRTALMAAAIAELIGVLEAFAARPEVLRQTIDAVDQFGSTALMLALQHSQVSAAKLLIDAGADVSIKQFDGTTTLMVAPTPEVARDILRRAPALGRAQDERGRTALMRVCQGGAGLVAVLLGTVADLGLEAMSSEGEAVDENISDVGCRDADGRVALHYAVDCGSAEAVRLLLARGADLTVVSGDGLAALLVSGEDYRRQCTDTEVASMLEAIIHAILHR
jgi:ankyrin repeat protein